MAEIFVLTLSESVPGHHDTTAKGVVIGVEFRDLPTLLWHQQTWEARAAEGIEFVLDSVQIAGKEILTFAKRIVDSGFVGHCCCGHAIPLNTGYRSRHRIAPRFLRSKW